MGVRFPRMRSKQCSIASRNRPCVGLKLPVLAGFDLRPLELRQYRYIEAQSSVDLPVFPAR